MKKKRNYVYRIALLGVLGAQALALSFLESFIPALPFMPPGAKPGLANIVTMFCMETMGFVPAMVITVLKSGFVFLTRGASAFFMSFAGGLLSTVSLYIMTKPKTRPFGLMGTAVVSAVCHNAGQLFASAILSGTWAMAYYAPVLLLLAVLTGVLTGSILKAVMPFLIKQSKFFDKGS